LHATMESLTSGVLRRIIEDGFRPESMTVQVLGMKEIGTGKFRLMLWDGSNEYKHAVLDISSSTYNVVAPEKFSIIKISDVLAPASVQTHHIREVKKEGSTTTYALVLYHYQEVKNGKVVGERMNSKGLINTDGHRLATGSPTQRFNATRTPPIATIKSEVQPPPMKVGPSTLSFNGNRHAVKRNLDDTFGSPQPKRINVESNATHQVADINPYINKYKIKVRVDSKAPVRNITNSKFQGAVLNCIVSDASGSIKVNAWDGNGREDTKHLDKLEAGKTYVLEGLQVKPVHNPKFNNTGHNYELTWCQNSAVMGPITDNPIRSMYKLVSINSLVNTEPETVVDIIGWVKEVGDLIEFRSKSEKDLKKREVVLADNSNGGSSINLVLWAEQAEQFNSHDVILAVKGAKLTEYNGVKNLSLGFSGSYEIAPPDMQEVEDLEEWASGIRGVIGTPSSQISQERRNTGEWSTLQEIKELLADNRSEKKFKVIARPIKIKTENMWYRAHQPRDGKMCRKKVTQNSSNMELFDCRCGDKKLSESETELRYMVNLCLADCTSSVWATMFSALPLFHMTPQEMHDLRIESESKFLDLISTAQFTESIFSVSAKVETFNQAPQLKFTVNDIEGIEWMDGGGKDHIARRWSEVVLMEKEMEVSHEEEFGIAVLGLAAFST